VSTVITYTRGQGLQIRERHHAVRDAITQKIKGQSSPHKTHPPHVTLTNGCQGQIGQWYSTLGRSS